MVDYFALLQQPRRPWLDEAALRQQFQSQSSGVHPDRVNSATPAEKIRANQHFAELNSAFSCLKSPHTRVRHLVELERGQRPGGLESVPNELATAFMKIAAASRLTEKLGAEKGRIQSPLLLAEFVERIQPHLELIEELQREVAALYIAALDRLRALDAVWLNSGDRDEMLVKLATLAQELGFLTRWQAQLQEAQLRLMP
jgi:hypothetical protein